MMMWIRGSAAGARGVALALLLSLGPSLARAGEPAATATTAARPSQEDMDRARVHFASGAALYEAGKYAAARDAFEESYRLSRLPDLLFNLAAVARKLEQPAEAMRYLEQYLAARPNAPDQDKVKADIEELRAELQKKEDEARAAQEAKQAAERAARPPAVVAPQPQPEHQPLLRRLPPWPALALGGGGVALLIVGVALGGAAHSLARTVESGASFDAALDSRGRALAGAGVAMDVIGALALGAGAAWTGVWLYRRSRPAQAPREALRLTPFGAGLTLSGGF